MGLRTRSECGFRSPDIYKKKTFCFRCSVPWIAMGHKHCCYFLLLVLCCERASPLKCIEDTNAGRLARINALKREILHKLQISAPPNVTRVHPITSSVFAEYNATIAAQAQVNKALQHCAQHGRSAKEIFVYFPVPVQGNTH